MGIEIFRRENWDRWESGPYHRADFRLDTEKDRWLLQHLLETAEGGKHACTMFSRIFMGTAPDLTPFWPGMRIARGDGVIDLDCGSVFPEYGGQPGCLRRGTPWSSIPWKGQ